MSDQEEWPPPTGKPVVPGPFEVPPQGPPLASSGPPRRPGGLRLALSVAAPVLVAVALVVGLVVANGHGSRPASHTAGGVGKGTVTATGPLVVPPAPPVQDSASADASALAAQATFTPPTATPSDVFTYGAKGLTMVSLPPFLSITAPSIKAKDQKGQTLADQLQAALAAWVEAWATGDVNDDRYRAWCAGQCRDLLSPLVAQWARAGIVPSGTVGFHAVAGGIDSDGTGLAAVCLDDSAVKAVQKSSGVSYPNPYPVGDTLYVFALVFDKNPAIDHWVITTGYSHTGDSYCADSGTSS